MGAPNAAWGIEIGAHALKAIRLERDGDRVVVSDFAYVPHKKVLSTPDLDQDEIIRISLGQFISQKSLEGEHLVMSVPGHAAFARFAKLPPVEPKKVPDIVKFEAVQQIPFPIEQVEWDYVTFQHDDSPEIEVGIFAITRERVQQRLALWGEIGVSPESMTLSPVAVYNALSYDLGLAPDAGPVIFLDIGTQATDVVIAEKGRCWIRTFPLGGTHFTEAIANAFKLSYSKAEKLKKEAATSKYAKQIMQAMRPVFSDLLQDLQRSIGYYQSLHRESPLNDVIGVGSTFKIPGLRKFIGQQLQINVQRLDEFRRIAVTGREASAFAEHAVNLGTAYGLALQGVGLAPIAANLMPVRALREQMWHAKTKWFAAAAAIIVAGAATTLYHPITDGAKIEKTEPREVADAQSLGEKWKNQYQGIRSEVGYTAANMLDLADDREVWPYLLADVATALQSTDPQEALLGGDPEAILGIPPEERRLVRLERLAGAYEFATSETGAGGTRRIAVTMEVALSKRDPVEFLTTTVATWLRENAEPTGDRADVPYRILVDTISTNPTMRRDVEIGADGAESESGGSGGTPGRPAPARPGAGVAPSGGMPSVPGGAPSPGGGGGRRQTPGSSAPPGGGLGGAPSPGGGGGRRATPGRMAAPGSAIGGESTSGGSAGPGALGGSPAGSAPAGGSSRSGSRPTGGDAGSEGGIDSGQLDQIAPLPTAPALFPAGSRYYRFPVTFVIEIVDGPTAPDAQAHGAPAAAGETSA